MRTGGICVALCGLALSAVSAQHVRTIEGPVLTPNEGFLIGNGDLSCSVYQEQDAIVFRLGKGDIWDRRVDDTGCMEPVTIREFIDGVLKEGWSANDWSASDVGSNGRVKNPERMKEIFKGKTLRKNVAPCPKPTGEFRIFTHPDLPAPKVVQRLIIEEGRYEIDLVWPNGVKLSAEAVVDPDENVLAVRWKGENWTDETRYGYNWSKSGPAWCGLMRWADPDWRVWSAKKAARNPTWPVMQWPDNVLPPLPAPSQVVIGGVRGIEQKFYPDEDYPQGFAYRMYLLADGSKGVLRPAQFDDKCEEWVHYLPQHGILECEVAIPVCTTRDGNLETVPVRKPYADYRAAACAAAGKFWSKSALAVPGDRFLEDAWYAVWHTRRCILKGGAAVPPGLFMPSIIDDFPRWNGDYHGNYNMQSIFWGEMTADRLEQAESFFQIVDFARPLGEKIAREYYGCRGCFIQLETFAVHTLKDPHPNLPLGRMAYMTGWAMTKYWEYYKYTLDKDWLREKGYPFMRDCALFYLDFLKKAPHPDLPPELNDGKYHAFPSVWGETGWKKPMDLCDARQVLDHARWCLMAAAQAAKELGVDSELQAQWTERFLNLPGTRSRPDQFNEADGPRDYQLHCWYAMLPEIGNGEPWRPSPKGGDGEDAEWKKRNDWLCYPGIEYYGKIQRVRRNSFKPDVLYPRWRDTLKRWMHPNGIVTAMTASFWTRDGWTESLSCMAPFQDMLLQSWDGAIRIFPRWPSQIDVGFRDFRAEGAFLVSASMENDKVTRFRIKSLKGGVCRVHGVWTVTDSAGRLITTERDAFGRLTFGSEVDGVYTLRQK